MKFAKKFDMEYTEPSLQYDSVDFTENDIVDAEYIVVNGFEEKPDIAALPIPFVGKRAVKEGSFVPPALTNKDVNSHLKIYSMRDLRIPLVNQGEINKRIYDGMVLSYRKRSYAVTERPVLLKTSDEADDIEINILASTRMHGETNSSGLIGLPGTGKSTALNIALERYPRAIKHTFENGHYIQIPIIRTTAYANSNMSALFISFANVLDEILDSENRHRNEMNKSDLGKKAEKIISWIKLYHIGCWIIEEAEFFSFTTERSSSFENIVTIMQETGIFLFATGNHDLMNKLNGNLRQERRLLANYIDMDLIHQNKDCMRMVTQEMWAFLLPEMKTELTDELFEKIDHWTLGSIDMISILLVSLQQEYVEQKNSKKKNVKVTAAFIEKVANAKLSRMRKLFLDGKTAAAVREYRQAQIEFDISIDKENQIVENANVYAEKQEEIEAGYNHLQKYCAVRDHITTSTDDYTEAQIKNAFNYCEEHVDEFKKMNKKGMIRAVLNRLDNVRNKKKTAKTKKIEKNLDEFQKELLREKGDE